MVKVRIAKSTATIDGWKWKADNPVLEQYLNGMLDPGGPEASDPDPDYTAAMAAVRRFEGAEVIEVDGPDAVHDEEAIY